MAENSMVNNGAPFISSHSYYGYMPININNEKSFGDVNNENSNVVNGQIKQEINLTMDVDTIDCQQKQAQHHFFQEQNKWTCLQNRKRSHNNTNFEDINNGFIPKHKKFREGEFQILN